MSILLRVVKCMQLNLLGPWLLGLAIPSRRDVGYVKKFLLADTGADLNYAALVSRKLNWEDYRVAYSAAGIIRYGTGGVPAAPRFINYVDYETPAPDFQPKLFC
jgi:hypothetical protein